MSDKQTCNEEMSSIKIKEFIKLDQIRSTKSKSFKTSSSIPASLPLLKENDFIPAGAKNGQFCERGDVYWRRDARYSNHRTFKCTRAQIRPNVRTVEHSDICHDFSSLAQNIVSNGKM